MGAQVQLVGKVPGGGWLGSRLPRTTAIFIVNQMFSILLLIICIFSSLIGTEFAGGYFEGGQLVYLFRCNGIHMLKEVHLV